MRKFNTNPNIDNSNLIDFPDGRIKDDTGSGDGTSVNERVYGDIVQFFLKLSRLAKLDANNQPDNETNGFQLIDALFAFSNKNNVSHDVLKSGLNLSVNLKLDTLRVNEIIIGIAQFNYTNEVNIVGSDSPTIVYSANVKGAFLTGDSLLIRKTSSGFDVESLATFSVLKKELYTAILEERNNNSLNIVFEDSSAVVSDGATYTIHVRKSCNSVEMQGVIKTVGTPLLGNLSVIKIKDSDFYPANNMLNVIGSVQDTISLTSPISSFYLFWNNATKTLKTGGVLPANSTFTFNCTYFIN